MDSKNRLEHIIHCLIEYRKLWLLPAIAGLVLATFYAFFIQGESWTSRQSMIIRDDLLGQNFKPGSFINEEAMKSAQETVLETARRPEVIRKTLETLGPETKSFLGFGGVSSSWPSDQLVEDFRGAVSFESANGGEFGKSEVIVLAAKGSSPKRSVEFLTILMDEIDSKLSQIRADRFRSMESELRATAESTLESKNLLEAELMEMEKALGLDINLVRSMSERAVGSPSAFETKLNEISLQRRDALRELAERRSIKNGLVRARKNSLDELPTSAELLASQPALSEMVTGLAKAKQELSEAESKFTSRDERVRSGRSKIASIKRQIQDSMVAIISGLDNQIDILEERVEIYDKLLAENARRLTDVSRKRVSYTTLSREVEKLNESYSEARARLTLMGSRKDSSDSIKLLTPIGEPWVGTRADGLGKRSQALIGAIAGLMIGLGMVVLVAPPFKDPESPLTERAQERDRAREASGMHRLDGLVPRHRGSVENEDRVVQEEPVPQMETAAADIVVEREVVPQPVPQAEVKPEVAPPASEPVQTSVHEELANITKAAKAAETKPTPVAKPTIPTEPIVPVPTTPVAQGESSGDVTPVSLPPKSEAPNPTETLPIPPVVVVPTGQSAAPTIPSIAIPSQEEIQSTQTDVPPASRVKTGSKTLAAIFANMPQPRTDLMEPAADEPEAVAGMESASAIADRIEELAQDLNNADRPEVQTTRDATQTIQLDGDLASTALPLQRRTPVRPVDLAKSEPGTSQQSIDNVFSQLKPPPLANQSRQEVPTD